MATVEVALPWVALAAEEVAHLMAQAAGDLQWEVQAVAVLLMEATEQVDDRLWEALAREVDDLRWVALAAEEVAHLMAQAAGDLQWEVQAVDGLRWVDQETGLHPVEELPSPNFSKRHSII